MKLKLTDLTPYARNSRLHSPAQLAKLEKSLTRFQQIKPILVWGPDNQIVAGHGIWQAMKQLGWEEAEVNRVDHLSEVEMRALVIADNRIASESEWIEEILHQELRELSDLKFDVELTGFEIDEIADQILADAGLTGKKPERETEEIDREIIGDDDRVFSERDDEEKETLNPRDVKIDEPLNDIPDRADSRCRLGDIWLLGSHRLICGDSTNLKTIERLFEGRIASFCFTSPPYADQRTYKGDKELSTEFLATFLTFAAPYVGMFAVNLGLSRKNYEISFYWDDYIKSAKSSNLKVLSWNVWDKGEAGSIGNQTALFAMAHEWIFVFGKEPHKLNLTMPNKSVGGLANHTGNRGADGEIKKSKDRIIADKSQLHTVTRMPAQKARDEYNHPARFPVELPRVYIEACSDLGDYIYEPFCGSGSALIACEQSGRKCLAVELDPHYCDIILARWEKLTGGEAVLASRESDADGAEVRVVSENENLSTGDEHDLAKISVSHDS